MDGYVPAEAMARVEWLLGPHQRVFTGKASSLARWADVMGWPVEHRRETALCLHALACEGGLGWTAHGAVLCGLSEQVLPWRAADLAWCLARWEKAQPADDACLELELPSAIATRLPPAELEPFAPVLARIQTELAEQHFVSAARRRRLVARLEAALDQVRGDPVPAWILNDSYALGVAVRGELGDLLRGPGCKELLTHCIDLASVSPNAKWRKRMRQLVEPGAVRAMAVGIVEVFASVAYDLTEDDDLLMRGLLWVLADDPSDPATALLAKATTLAATAPADSPGYPHAPRAANAGVQILAERGGAEAMAVLARLSLTVRNKSLATRIRSALGQLGAARGWTLAEVMELAVDDHGLDGQGRAVEHIDGYEVVIQIVGDRAQLAVSREGKTLKSVPAALKPEQKRLRELVKRIDRTLAAERLRAEGLLSEERRWSYADWARRYLEHPVTSTLGRRLIWEAGDEGAWQAGIPQRAGDGDEWALRGLDGQAVSGAVVRLWHPARAEPDQVRLWRDHIVAAEVRQPFKQAFREVYLLTPAEEETSAYSNRFAAHILRYRQANALMRVRGWHASYLGTWDGGSDSEATKELGGGGWRASFYHSLVANADRFDYDARYCSTDQVRFARRDGTGWQPVPVTEVPTLVFSEAMRDVDLFVGVTSIAADPAWTDHGEERFHNYWHTTSFGELTPSAEMRREALTRILSRTKLAGRVQLGERFLRVQGVHRAYRIHLGSGNILMEPNDEYLCIVPARNRTDATIHLPFDEDAMLSMILSKAFLLAADDRITDPTILRQLRRPT